jgi:hypothetical protein
VIYPFPNPQDLSEKALDNYHGMWDEALTFLVASAYTQQHPLSPSPQTANHILALTHSVDFSQLSFSIFVESISTVPCR